METWFEAGIYCEETYGMTLNIKEGYFVCPECGEPIHEIDWHKHDDWNVCPVCGFDFWEG